MIIWIASYPKSGNTWMKLFLKAYLNPSNTNFSINPNLQDSISVETFPIVEKYKDLGIKFENFEEIAKNWINMQSLINLNNKTNYLKTHNAMCTINNYKFTDQENTLGAIYIVRDPRDIAISYSNFLDKNIDDTIAYMLSSMCYEQDIFENKLYKKSIMGNWGFHYKSWNDFKLKEKIIIRYEDMKNKTNETFYKVLKFLNKINDVKIDKKKMQISIKQTTFKNLQRLETVDGFEENPSKMPFFRKGEVGEWKNNLDKKQSQKIEKAFDKEMKELKYL